MSPRRGAPESLPSGPRLGEKDRVTDDPKPPGEGGIPPIPRPRRSKRKRDRQRDWLRPSKAPPALAGPAASRMLVIGALVLSAIGVAVWIAGRAPVVPEKVFLNPAKVEVGTSAEAIASTAKERDEKRAFAEKLFGPELWQVKDGTDFAEEPQWRRALEVMANLDEKFIEENLQFSLNLHYSEVMEHPEAFRGQFVRMRGVIHHTFGAVKLDQPVAGRVDVFRGPIADPDDESPIVFFDLLDRPPDFDEGYDGMELDAVFYRVVTYETKYGKLKSAPWLIGRTVSVIEKPKAEAKTWTSLGVMTAFLALVFSIVYLVRRGGRRRTVSGVNPADFRAMFERKLGDERPKDPPSPSGGGV
jgi:hypothetical protein